MEKRKVLKRLVWAVAIVAVLWTAVVLTFDGIVRNRLEAVASKAAGPGYTVRIGNVDTHIFQGSMEVRDVTLTFDTLRTDSLLAGLRRSLLQAKADRISVQGLSYWQLLRDGTVVVDQVELDAPEIDHFFRSLADSAVVDSVVPMNTEELPPLIAVDSLRILRAHGGTHDVSGKQADANVQELDILCGGLVLLPGPEGGTVFRARSAVLLARGVTAAFPPLYDLSFGSLELAHPAGTARITMAAFTPRVNELEYGKVVKDETDLFHAKVDTLTLTGLDVSRFLAEQELHVRYVELNAPLLVIHRDKTMPDGPFKPKRLPPAGLRAMTWALHIDTIALRNGRVDYNERDTLNAEYGRVSFTHMDALLMGLSNDPAVIPHGALRLEATCQVYEKSRLKARYEAPLDPKNGTFTVTAQLSELPFTVFNRMTDSLLQVKVNSGRIDELELHMRGNNDEATGTLDLVYHDLDVELRSNDPRQPRTWLLNTAVNALVRRDNLKENKDYRQGTFTVVRRKDRSIFNYVWRAVRSGTLDSMVPGSLSKYAQSKANKKAKGKKK